MIERRLPHRITTAEPLNDPAGWTAHAACRDTDPEDWFIDGDGSTWGDPKHADRRALLERICQGCPVIAECLKTAVEQRDAHAFRGGMTPQQRRQFKRTGKAPTAAGSATSRAAKMQRNLERIEAAMKADPTLTIALLSRKLDIPNTTIRDNLMRLSPEVRAQLRANGREAQARRAS